MSPKQKRISSSAVFKILKKNGFKNISQKGSHQKWKNYLSGKQVIVPHHKGKDLPIGTLKAIIDGSGISLSEWQ